MGLAILFHAAIETARISYPTVIDAHRGVLRHEDCDRRLRGWARRLLERVGAEVSVEGLENIAPESGPYVVVSNHESHYDIPLLFVGLPFSLRMAAKKELFRTPLWGPALRASGFVEIDRSSPKAAYKALRAAGEAMRANSISLFIAPEGTRTPDGTLGKFKKGAFDVARVMRVPILPVAIVGTRAIHGKGSKTVQLGQKVSMKVLPPVQPSDFGNLETLALDVRQRIADALGSAAG